MHNVTNCGRKPYHPIQVNVINTTFSVSSTLLPFLPLFGSCFFVTIPLLFLLFPFSRSAFLFPLPASFYGAQDYDPVMFPLHGFQIRFARLDDQAYSVLNTSGGIDPRFGLRLIYLKHQCIGICVGGWCAHVESADLLGVDPVFMKSHLSGRGVFSYDEMDIKVLEIASWIDLCELIVWCYVVGLLCRTRWNIFSKPLQR